MNALHTHSLHITQNHVQRPSRLRSDMVRPATARLPVIMSVRPSQRCTQQPPRRRLKPLRHRLRRHQNRNTAGVSDHLKLRCPPFGTHSRAPTTIKGSTSTQSPSLGTATGMWKSLSKIFGRTSNKITRWPCHVTTPRTSTRTPHTTSLDATKERDESRTITLMPSPEYSHREGPL
jgi:hypothetical protein